MTPYELAKVEIGTVEWAKGSNPKVIQYYKDAGHPEVKDDAVAWCAAFVGAMITRGEGKPTGSLAARSYLDWGKPVDLADAKPGDIVVFRRGNSTWQGHVGFYVSHGGGSIQVLGGNQRDAVNIAPQPVSKLLGVRRAVPVLDHVSKTPEIEHVAPDVSAKPQSINTSSFWARIIAIIAIIKGHRS